MGEGRGIYSVGMFHMNEGRLLEQIVWTVPKVGPCFILNALLFKGFAVISGPCESGH